MADAAVEALGIIFSPQTIAFLLLGTAVGLFTGLMPGLGGVTGMTILIPFIFGMDPHAAIAMLVGLTAVNNTSDTLGAVVLGVPGSTGAAATVLDGHAMALKGEAGRALGAGYLSSMLGGLIGAAALFFFLPIARPAILALGSPELFMFVLLGISVVGTLVRGSALAGLSGVFLGLLVSSMGMAPATAEPRFVFGSLHLMSGISISVFALGLYAIPELVDMVRAVPPDRRREAKDDIRRSGVLGGVRDVVRNKMTLLGGSIVGIVVGLMPGLGGSASSWVAYALASRFSKNAEGFGEGDVRGVIAPEASNNSNDGAELIPTLLFGIPAGAAMAVILGALTIIGIVPGPNLLRDENLPTVLVVVWSLVLANVIATLVMMVSSTQLIKLLRVQPTVLAAIISVVVFVAAFQNRRSWMDIYLVMIIGAFGWLIKQARWPRPPILVGFVLGPSLERYLTIWYGRFNLEWANRPLVIILGIATLAMIILGITGQSAKIVEGQSRLPTKLARRKKKLTSTGEER